MVMELDEETSKRIYFELQSILNDINTTNKCAHLQKLKNELDALHVEQTSLIPGLPKDLVSAIPPELQIELSLQLKEAYLKLAHESCFSNKEQNDKQACERADKEIEIPEEMVDLQLQQEFLLRSIPRELMAQLEPDLANCLRAAVLDGVKQVSKEEIEKEVCKPEDIETEIDLPAMHTERKEKEVNITEKFEDVVEIQLEQSKLLENIPEELMRNLPQELREIFKQGLLEGVQQIENSNQQIGTEQSKNTYDTVAFVEDVIIDHKKPSELKDCLTKSVVDASFARGEEFFIQSESNIGVVMKKARKEEDVEKKLNTGQLLVENTSPNLSEADMKLDFLSEPSSVPSESKLISNEDEERRFNSLQKESDLLISEVKSANFPNVSAMPENFSTGNENFVNNLGSEQLQGHPVRKSSFSHEVQPDPDISIKEANNAVRILEKELPLITSNTEGITNISIPERQDKEEGEIEEIVVSTDESNQTVQQLDSCDALLVQEHAVIESVCKMKFLTELMKRKVNRDSSEESCDQRLFTSTEISTFESKKETKTSIKDNLENVKHYISKKQIVVVQKTIITIVESVSKWLDNVEYKILKVKKIKSVQKKKQELKNIKDEIEVIEETVDELIEVTEMAIEIFNDETRVTVSSCVDCLKEQVRTVKLFHQKSENELEESEDQWEEFLTGVDMAEQLISDLKSAVHNQNVKDEVSESSVEVLEDLETSNKGHRNKVVYLMRTGHGLANILPENELPETLEHMYNDSKAIEEVILKNKERKINLMVCKQEYEETLKEFKEIFVIAENFFSQSLSALDLNHFKKELDRQQRFFLNLSHCLQILNSMQENLGPALMEHYLDEHEDIKMQGGKLLEQAAEHVQLLEETAERWAQVKIRIIKLLEEVNHLNSDMQSTELLADLSRGNHILKHEVLLEYHRVVTNYIIETSQLKAFASDIENVVRSPELASMFDELKRELEAIENCSKQKKGNLKKLCDLWQQYADIHETLMIWMNVVEEGQHDNQTQNDILIDELVLYEAMLAKSRIYLAQVTGMFQLTDEDLQRQLHDQLEERFSSLKKRLLDSSKIQEQPIEDSVQIERMQVLLQTAHAILENESGTELILLEQLQKNISQINLVTRHLSQQLNLLQDLCREWKDPDQFQAIGSLLSEARMIEKALQQMLELKSNVLHLKTSFHSTLSEVAVEIKDLEAGLSHCKTAAASGNYDQLANLSISVKVRHF